MKNISCVILACLMATHVSATEISQTDINEQNNISDAATKDITPKTLDDFFDEFANRHSIQYGEDSTGKVFFTGRATVALSATDPSFV